MRFRVLVMVGALLTLPPAPRAQDSLRNAFGVYAAPTSHTVTSMGDFNEGPTNTSLDLGIYYARFFTPRFSMRIEARMTDRNADYYHGSPVPASSPPEFSRVDESFLEFPLVLQSDTRARFGERAVRLSIGGGVCYSVLTAQEWYGQYYDSPFSTRWIKHEAGFGDSQRLAFLLDGGVTMEVRGRESVFLRFRLQEDGYIFETSPGYDVFAEWYRAYGFMAGLEWPF